MVSSIISNIAAFSAQGNIAAASGKAAASIARLSSGNRLNKASDDVAGLATGTSLRTQVTTLRTALANASQGTSLLQVADGALSQIVDILQRQKAIAVQAGSGSLTDANRSLLNQEFQNLVSEVDRISSSANFNGVNLLAGGLGAKTIQVATDALAGTSIVAAPGQNATGGAAVVSTTAVQAFDIDAGTSRAGTGSAGFLSFTDSLGTALANAAFDNLDGSLYGQFSKFEFSNVTYGATGVGAATLTATINGVEFSGNVVSNGAATAILQHGTSYIKLALGAVALTDAGTQSLAVNNITNLFSTTVITRTSTIQGVNFEGTVLDGAIGSATNGNASIRLFTNGQADITNFQYIAGTAADANTLTVQVNGKTFTASGVKDNITAAQGAIQFLGAGRGEVLSINLTGFLPAAGIVNIRTSLTDREAFVSALNVGFAQAGSGLNFSIGSQKTDAIRVQFGSASTSAIYGGQTLDVSSAATAANASSVLDSAITTVVSLRATVGALQSRFNFASNAIQSSIENQDAARGALLDTDVSSESTAFSSAQVQLQAGIAVLAQANQLPQNLLKLIQ
ncbi:MAG: flagellin [Pseudomonadota bacterium]